MTHPGNESEQGPLWSAKPSWAVDLHFDGGGDAERADDEALVGVLRVELDAVLIGPGALVDGVREGESSEREEREERAHGESLDVSDGVDSWGRLAYPA